MTRTWRSQLCQRPLTPAHRPSSISQWSRFYRGNPTDSRCTGTHSICPNLQQRMVSGTRKLLCLTRYLNACAWTQELARRSAIYASLADPMVASVIEELSPKDHSWISCCGRNWPLFKRPKSLQSRQGLQPHPTFSFSGGTCCSKTLPSSLRFWSRWGQRHSKVLTSWAQNPRNFSLWEWHPFLLAVTEWGLVMYCMLSFVSPVSFLTLYIDPVNWVRAVRQADRTTGSSVTFVQKPRDTKTTTKVTFSSKKNQSRSSRLWSEVVHLQRPPCRELGIKSDPFVPAPTEELAIDPILTSNRGLGRLLQLPQPVSVDWVQVGPDRRRTDPHCHGWKLYSSSHCNAVKLHSQLYSWQDCHP